MPPALRYPIELDQERREVFWSRVNMTPNTSDADCWLWVGGADNFGYGVFRSGRRTLKAHRVAWTLIRGPVPDGLMLDHLCRVPRCVNPKHLELVTNRENILRGDSPTATNARKTHCRRGHQLSPENVSIEQGTMRKCKVCRRIRQNSYYALRAAGENRR